MNEWMNKWMRDCIIAEGRYFEEEQVTEPIMDSE